MLRAKLRRPVVPEHHVRRPRLLRLLDEAVGAPLTLVVAPAGVGKTVLVSSWAAESTVPTAWLSLDEADRDGRQLWAGVIAALETLRPRCGKAALTLLRRPGPLDGVVRRLLDDLDSGADSSCVLVIDDLDLVDDDPAAASLALFLQHLPRWLHVVLLSRRVPDLPVDRLQGRGQLGEIHFADLRFSHEEACEMLTRLVPGLPKDQIDATATHAAGWAAGLQLAALTARAHQPMELPPVEGDLLVGDYVWREVLAAEDTELVETLLDVSVADLIDPSLARALTGREDADRILARAEARGLFVARLGPEGWFAVHSLVRSVLLAELGRRSPSRLIEQHARVARWLEDAGEVAAALEHWLLAGRHRDALRLLAITHTALYDGGREAAILRTLAGLPPELATADVESLLEFAWCHFLVERRRFLELVDHATWWVDRADGPRLDDTLRARLTMLQSIAATTGGDWLEGKALARRAMSDLGDAWWRDPLGHFGWTMVARACALSECWNDTGDDVREAGLALSRHPERRLAFEGTRALGEALAGRPADALRVAAGVRRAAEVANMTILRTELALAEAMAHRELGDRGRALPALAALAEAPAETTLYCRILATLELAQARLDEGDVDTAQRVFGQAEALIESESFEPGGRNWLARVGTQLAVATGEIDDARRWAGKVDDPFWGGVSAARVQLAVGARVEAVQTLAEVAPRCVRHEVVLGLLRARAVGDDESTKYAIAAVELATADGLLQTVASEGADAIELIERSAWRVSPQWLDRLRRAAAEGANRWPGAAAGAVEPLTERERDVLRFLASRLTVREIAEELYVSVNTLKFHLKAIYRKLGVNSRAEATEAARHMSLVRPD